MNLKKQKLLLEYLISDEDVFAQCLPVLKASFFDISLRKATSFILKYYTEHSNLPEPDLIEAESNIALNLRDITIDKKDYCIREVEAFCKNSNLRDAIMDIVQNHISDDDSDKEPNYGEIWNIINDATSFAIDTDLGVDYSTDPMKRLQDMENANTILPTGLIAMDNRLGGGIAKKEMILFVGKSGGGKSITMANIGMSMAQLGNHVVYLSIELDQNMVAQRYDTMLTGYGRGTWKEHKDEIAEAVNKFNESVTGSLIIKYMPPETNAMQMRSYLKKYYLKYKRYPDVFIVDYLDNMGSNEQIDANNISLKDKKSTEQLRTLGVEYDMAIVTASQFNREGTKANNPQHAHIAGGMGKINTTDVFAAIDLTEQQKAAGMMSITWLKIRSNSGVEQSDIFGWDNKKLRITNLNGVKKPKNPPINNSDKSNRAVPKTADNDDILSYVTSRI